MTPTTERNVDESKDTRRAVAADAAEVRKPWTRRPPPDDHGTVRTVWLQPQARDQAAGSQGGVGRRSHRAQRASAALRGGGGGRAGAHLESSGATVRQAPGGVAGTLVAV